MDNGYNAGQSAENFDAAAARVRQSGPSRHLSAEAKAMLSPLERAMHISDYRECTVNDCVRPLIPDTVNQGICWPHRDPRPSR